MLANAADLASVDGLDGLSIGRLAAVANVSKSGIATLFGTKERLQLATVAAARERFQETVIEPARVEPRGIRRLVALFDAWIAYSRDRVFPGGCFFGAAQIDVDAKAGPVHDAVAEPCSSGTATSPCRSATRSPGASWPPTPMPHSSRSSATHCSTPRTAARCSCTSNTPYVRARRGLVSRLLAAGAEPGVVAPLADVDDEAFAAR